MIESAIEHMRGIQMQSLASEAVYRPLGGEAHTIRAVVGRTVFRSPDENGVWTRVETRDFIVTREQLPSEPQVGDEVEFLGGTYEVLAPAGEPCWRWSDAFKTAYRIHAKHTGGG